MLRSLVTWLLLTYVLLLVMSVLGGGFGIAAPEMAVAGVVAAGITAWDSRRRTRRAGH